MKVSVRRICGFALAALLLIGLLPLGLQTAYAAETPIETVQLTVTEPAAGANPAAPAAAGEANYMLEAHSWSEAGSGDEFTGPFEAGKTYSLSVLLSPNSDYTFDDNVTATVNGKSATVTLVQLPDTTKIDVSISFATPEETEEKWVLTFYPGDGQGSSFEIEVKKGDSLSMPSCDFTPPDGEKFTHWEVEGDGQSYAPGDGYTPAGDTSVYARYAKTYALTLVISTQDEQGNSLNESGGTTNLDKTEAAAQEKVTVTAEPADGFKLLRAEYVADGENAVDITQALSFQMPDKPTTVNVVFQKKVQVETYTVTFNANGGTGQMDAILVPVGQKLTLPNCGFTPPAGKVFDKWDAGRPGEQVEITGDREIRAIWKDKGGVPGLTFYEFTKGANSSWTKGSEYALYFAVSRSVDDGSTYARFLRLAVDGDTLDTAYYTVLEGITGGIRIWLMPGYLKTLSNDEHVLTAVFNDGVASTRFTILKASSTAYVYPLPPEYFKPASGKSPKTGNEGTTWLYLAWLGLALGTAASAVCIREIRKKS